MKCVKKAPVPTVSSVVFHDMFIHFHLSRHASSLCWVYSGAVCWTKELALRKPNWRRFAKAAESTGEKKDTTRRYLVNNGRYSYLQIYYENEVNDGI